jgi:tetratricopeptide (TPR) repeat protein
MSELNAGNPAGAVEFFLQAIAIDPGMKHYYNNLGAAYIRMGEYSKAEEHLKLSLKIDGNYARALSNMSVALFYLGRYREAYNYYLLTKRADREYSEKRFEKKRVSSAIKKLSDAKPDDEELKKIKEYMEADGE